MRDISPQKVNIQSSTCYREISIIKIKTLKYILFPFMEYFYCILLSYIILFAVFEIYIDLLILIFQHNLLEESVKSFTRRISAKQELQFEVFYLVLVFNSTWRLNVAYNL